MPDPLRLEIAEAIDRLGVKEVSRRLSLGEIPLMRLASGVVVRRATRELARLNLPRLAEPERRAP